MTLTPARLLGSVRFGIEQRAHLVALPVLTALSFALVASDARSQETVRVSVDSSGVEGNAQSGTVDLTSISSDGTIIAFSSYATNLVTGDLNGAGDVFVHDRTTNTTDRVSVDSSGNEGDSSSGGPTLSSDGTIVAFSSYADNLVSSDTNAKIDVFVRDRSTGITERVSVSTSGAEADGDSYWAAISADGRFVAFTSNSSNLVAGYSPVQQDVYLHDRVAGTTELVSVSSLGVPGNSISVFPSISSDGRFVAFESSASNLVPGDTNKQEDIFVRDRSSGTTERVSISTSGLQGDWPSGSAAISRDGEVVAFSSFATNLVSGDKNNKVDVFVHDRTTGVTERVSVDSAGVEGNGDSSDGLGMPVGLSADGQIVAFGSYASNLVSNDLNGRSDVFIHDRSSGSTERVSVDSSGSEADGDSSFAPGLSDDGQVVAFASVASNLVANDTNGTSDCFVHDPCAVLGAWSNYGAGFPGTLGVPSFTSNANPVFGASITLSLANSYGPPTIGVLLVGFQQASFHTNRGGDLLVTPAITLLTALSSGSNAYGGTIPDHDSLCGTTIDCQALEVDPGAAYGISFTQGLELTIGR